MSEQIAVELTNEEWFELMSLAHRRDITLNQLVNDILMGHLNIREMEQENVKE